MARCGNGHDSETVDYCDICGVPIGAGGSTDGSGPSGGAGGSLDAGLVGSGSPGSGSGAGSVGDGAAGAELSTGSGSGSGSGFGSGRHAATTARPQTCGGCEAQLLAGARFCEQCGWDAEAADLGGNPDGAVASGAPVPQLLAPRQIPAPRPEAPPATPAGWQLLAVADRDYFDTVQAMDGADVSSLNFPVYWPERRFPLASERILIGRSSRSRGITPDIDLGGQFVDPGISHLHAVLVAGEDGGWTVADLGSSNGTYLNDSMEPLRPHVPVPVTEQDEIHVGAWTTLTLHGGY